MPATRTEATTRSTPSFFIVDWSFCQARRCLIDFLNYRMREGRLGEPSHVLAFGSRGSTDLGAARVSPVIGVVVLLVEAELVILSEALR